MKNNRKGAPRNSFSVSFCRKPLSTQFVDCTSEYNLTMMISRRLRPSLKLRDASLHASQASFLGGVSNINCYLSTYTRHSVFLPNGKDKGWAWGHIASRGKESPCSPILNIQNELLHLGKTIFYVEVITAENREYLRKKPRRST